MKKINSRIQLFILIFVLIISTGAVAYFAWESHNNYKKTIENQWYQQLLTTTRIVTLNLESFVNKFSQNLLIVANNPDVQKTTYNNDTARCDSGYCTIRSLYNVHKEDVDAILLLNENGDVINQYPSCHEVACIKDMHCLQGVMDSDNFVQGQTYVGKIFKNIYDKPAITISCPIYYREEFAGVIRWMVSINTISQKYIDSIRVGENGYLWMIDDSYNILSHHHEQLLNQNLLDRENKPLQGNRAKTNDPNNSKYDKEIEEFVELLKTQEEGEGRFVDLAHNEHSLAVFKKVSIGDSRWTLIMNLPFSELTRPIYYNAIKNFAFALAVSLIIILISISFYRNRKKKIQLEIETKYLSEIAHSASELEKERSKRLTALIDGQEIERERVSRELHDGLGQYLLAIKMKIENIPSSGTEKIESLKNEIKSLFNKTITETKRISSNIVPVELDELGIVAAISKLCDDISKNNGIQVDFVNYGIVEELDNKIETYLYRIAQEALSNVIKHSKANEVNVQLLGNKEQITLILQDDGVGFDKNMNSIKSKGNGLHNMKERVSILNGSINLNSSIGEGTTVEVKIPINPT